jgi:hypothetical protein
MRRYALPVVLLAVTVGLAGCASEESDPRPTASAPATDPGSATADPTPPEPPAGGAGDAAVTVSAEDTDAGHGGGNAIDGDLSTDWATGDAAVGEASTILLEWHDARELGAIVLSDRANTDDNVVAGTLEFADGSTVLTPPLPENGEPLRIEFAPRFTDSLLFRIDEVSPSTSDVGLAEIEAFAPDRIAALLGVERILADAGAVAGIRPTAVATVEETDGMRLVRVELAIEILAGAAEVSPWWFTMLGPDGAHYAPVDDPADDLADPIAQESLSAGDTITGTVHFEIPSDESGFRIGGTLDPDGEPFATWSLNAP